MSKWVTVCTWKDAPHLTPAAIARMEESMSPHQRSARAEGMPAMGSGLVYPIEESAIRIANFALPPHFKRAYAFDTGWNWNAAVWGAYDPDPDTVHVYDCYKRGAAEPPINASAILSRGAWIPGVADAADINRLDGKQYIEIYRGLGLDVELPDKAFETGIQQVWTRLTTGRLKIFDSCQEVFEEFRVYARNDRGVIADNPRHDLLDALRYLVMAIVRRAKLPPQRKPLIFSETGSPLSWMG